MLVPRVFSTYLRLGTPPREKLNQILLKNAFDERLEYLIAMTDELVGAPFFWNDQVMPLCTKQRIAEKYSILNQASLDRGGSLLRCWHRTFGPYFWATGLLQVTARTSSHLRSPSLAFSS